MSDEIFINTGTSIQQPFNQRNPAQGTQPAVAQRVAQQPAITQQPFTYTNRSPFTYRHPADARQPYIANARQPYPYIANAQTPFIANTRQPYPYIANAQQPYPYIANSQTPSIADARQPYPYIANSQSPSIVNAQQPYPYIANSQSPSIVNAQQPYPYIANSQTSVNAQQPYPYIANSQTSVPARQPSTYSHTTVTNVTVNETISFGEQGPLSGTLPNGSAAHVKSHNIYMDLTDIDTAFSSIIAGQLYFTMFITTSSGSRTFNLDVDRNAGSGTVADVYEGGVINPNNIGSVSLTQNTAYRDVLSYVFPSASTPTTFGFVTTTAASTADVGGAGTASVGSAYGAADVNGNGGGTIYTLSEGTTNSTVSDNVFGFTLTTTSDRSNNTSLATHSISFRFEFNRSGFPTYTAEDITVGHDVEHSYSGSPPPGGGGGGSGSGGGDGEAV